MLTEPSPAREMLARPNAAPAYYQGRPAALIIAAMSPRPNRPAAARHLVSVPGPRLPQLSGTVPPAPLLSAVHSTSRSHRRTSGASLDPRWGA